MAKEIEWGAGIDGPTMKALNLPGDTRVRSYSMTLDYSLWDFTDLETAYHLPADHPYYLVSRYNAEHGTNFTLWMGGYEAPSDWDGGGGSL